MKKTLLSILYFLSPFVLIAALYFSIPGRYTNSTLLIGMIIGAIAYTWLTMQFMLSARPKFIERSFGMDKLYRFHAWIAIAALVVAFIHRQLFEELFGENTMTTLGTAALVIFITISVLSMLLMTTSIFHKIKAVSWVKKTIEKLTKIKYQHLRLIHNLTIIAFALMNIHVLLTINAKMFPLIRGIYWVYFVSALLFYIYHKFIKTAVLKSRSLLVKNVIQASPTMYSIEMTPKAGKTLKYMPGQFGFFSFLQKGLTKEEHPFSISSSPHDESVVSVTIKKLGDFTSKIGSVVPGTEVLLDAPYGRFTYVVHPEEKDLVMIAGGVGITPILSMMRHLHHVEKQRKVILLWGMNTLDDFIFRSEFMEMKKEMPNLFLVPVVAFDPNYEGEKGFIDQEKIARWLDISKVDQDNTGFYVCGPAVMMEKTIQNLSKIGIHKKHIHFEKFSL